MDFCQVTCVGRLTRDPEVREAGSSKVANFSLAINRFFKDEKQVTFVDCQVWGKQADVVEQYVKKGDTLLVSGHLRQDKWEKDGKSFSKLIVNADTVRLSSKGSNGGESDGDSEAPVRRERQPARAASGGSGGAGRARTSSRARSKNEEVESEVATDDIPW